MKALLVAKKSLTETMRQPRNLALTLGLPVVFMVIFGLAFGAGEFNETYAVGVVDQDEGSLGARYVEGLREMTYDDGTPLLSVVELAVAEDGRARLEGRTLDAIIVVPANFTRGLTPTTAPGAPGGPAGLGPGTSQRVPPPGTEVELLGDPAFGDYGAVSRIVDAYSRAFAEQATQQPAPLRVQAQSVASNQLTQFDRIAPGLMVFAILNMVPQAAAMLAREVELGTIDRLRQSPARAAHILGGVTLAQAVIATASVALMLLTARLMGFHNQGSYVAAYVVALGAALGVVGVGMVVAAMVRTQQEASNLGTLIAVPASFLSGAFFDLPSVALFSWGDRVIGLYDVLPTTHAVEAMRAVLTFGRDLSSVAWSLGALAVLGALWFAAGLLLYRRTRLAIA